MDSIKRGAFIAERRKALGLTRHDAAPPFICTERFGVPLFFAS